MSASEYRLQVTCFQPITTQCVTAAACAAVLVCPLNEVEVGNGVCDDRLNIPNCNWDGGELSVSLFNFLSMCPLPEDVKALRSECHLLQTSESIH